MKVGADFCRVVWLFCWWMLKKPLVGTPDAIGKLNMMFPPEFLKATYVK